jgi:formylglycine-generating enzyme required for sulfatase activity
MKINFCFLMLIMMISCGQKSHEIVRENGMVLIPSGILAMGGDNDQADPDEFPKHDVQIKSFWMDETEVTNRQYKEFVDATGYETIAERKIDWEEMKTQLPPGTPKPHDSILQPGALVFQPTDGPVPLDNPGQWWAWTKGADWKHPEGLDSDITLRMDHPVVQIAWEDAYAYCEWAGKRLPTEAEWEWAARGGLANAIYPWGNEPVETGDPKANFFQGQFPFKDMVLDGYPGTAPVRSFSANGYGLYDMAGNVWEWCADWYNYEYYKEQKTSESGPEESYDPYQPYTPVKVTRGGSFLCSEVYCSGYRNARRMKSSPDTGLNHNGFRCVKDL